MNTKDMGRQGLLGALSPGGTTLAWRAPEGVWATYGDLADRVEALSRRYPPGRQLVWLPFGTTTVHLAHYLLGLRDGHVMMLADPALPAEQVASEMRRFGVSVAVGADAEPTLCGPPPALDPSLALMLPTSGSTGGRKWVRLSHANLIANAQAIVEYLQLAPADRAVTSLPLFHAYGLSVLNSHLLVGASLVATTEGPLARGFWEVVASERVTHFAGVPFTWRTLARLRFDLARYPHLMTLTQAGGRLEPELVLHFAAAAKAHGRRFFVMYGQTEAAPRMAFLTTEEALEAPEAIGRAIPGGVLSIRPVPGAPEGEGELVYRGANVMLGYAETAVDLARGPDLAELSTGDLARQDAAGRFHITGRLSRFVKLAGRRMNLADIETWLAAYGHEAAALGEDERLDVAVEGASEAALAPLGRSLAAWLKVPPALVRVASVPALPRTANLKVDYPRLRLLLAGGSP